MSAQVVRITHNGRGSATGVVLVVETAGGPVERRIAADQVVVAAGAVESPRLLLASGLGNEWTGRNSHSHGFVLALAGSGPAIKDFRGPGHTTATFDFVHTDPTAWGGGVIFDANPFYPVLQAGFASMFSGAPFGAKHKQWMRDHPVLLGTMSMVQEIPHEFSRVRLDPTVVDRYGMPAARIRGRAHPASVRACEYVKVHCEAWLDEVGGRDIKSIVAPGGSPGGEHGAGSVRMGHDPAMSACDAAGRLHGTTNVYVADASLHPTNGSVNPALTIMANAMRTAELVAAARGAS
jgi:choline dehydrogenase-like flavoprotein